MRGLGNLRMVLRGARPRAPRRTLRWATASAVLFASAFAAFIVSAPAGANTAGSNPTPVCTSTGLCTITFTYTGTPGVDSTTSYTWTLPTNTAITSMNMLVVGGGGGGGGEAWGGGGGGGSVIVDTNEPLASSGTALTYGASVNVSVGSGGVGGANPGSASAGGGSCTSNCASHTFDQGYAGGTSAVTIGSNTASALGGGGGGGYVAVNWNSPAEEALYANGTGAGNGGGQSEEGTNPATATAPSVASAFTGTISKNGGKTSGAGSTTYGQAGTGGAGAGGSSAAISANGYGTTGGAGVSVSMPGIATATYGCGGGGAGFIQAANGGCATAGNGGLGQTSGGSNAAATAGTASYGGGGGGAPYAGGNGGPGANGGSGVVIFSWQAPVVSFYNNFPSGATTTGSTTCPSGSNYTAVTVSGATCSVVLSGSSVALPDPSTMTVKGSGGWYNFAGWCTTAACTGVDGSTLYQFTGGAFTNSSPTISGSTTLYADWVPMGTTSGWSLLNTFNNTTFSGVNTIKVAYDAGTDQLVMVSTNATGDSLGTAERTYVMNPSTGEWQQLSPATSPPAVSAETFGYDAATNQLLLVGGYTGSTYAGTWSWNGTTWTQVATSIPNISTNLTYASMAYDAATGQMIMFGGSNGSDLQYTWVWNGTSWVQISYPGETAQPSVREYAPMAYDPAIRAIVLYGGFHSGTSYTDTWEWTGASWAQLSPSPAGSGQSTNSTLVFDPDINELVLVGGGSTNTQVFNGSGWEVVSTLAQPNTLQGEEDAAYFPDNHEIVTVDGNFNNVYPTNLPTYALKPNPNTIQFTNAPSSTAVNATWTPTTSIDSGLSGAGMTVGYSIDAGSTSGACSISGSTVTFNAVGACIVDAKETSGSGIYLQTTSKVIDVGQASFTAPSATSEVIGTSGNTISGFSLPTSSLATSTYLVTLSAANGNLTLPTTTNLTISPGSAFTGQSTIYFTVASSNVSSLNSDLATLQYNAPGSVGTDTVTMNVYPMNAGMTFSAYTGHFYSYVSSTNYWNVAANAARSTNFLGATGALADVPNQNSTTMTNLNSVFTTLIGTGTSGNTNVWLGAMASEWPNYAPSCESSVAIPYAETSPTAYCSTGTPGTPSTSVQRIWRWAGGAYQDNLVSLCSNYGTTTGTGSACTHTGDSSVSYAWNSGEPNDSNSGSNGDPGEHYLEFVAGNSAGSQWNDISNGNLEPSIYEYGTQTSVTGQLLYGNQVTGFSPFATSFTVNDRNVGPTNPTVIAMPTSVQVGWTPPSNYATYAPSTYTITAYAGSSATGTPVGTCTYTSGDSGTCTGLSANTQYTFSVTATTTQGVTMATTITATTTTANNGPTTNKASPIPPVALYGFSSSGVEVVVTTSTGQLSLGTTTGLTASGNSSFTPAAAKPLAFMGTLANVNSDINRATAGILINAATAPTISIQVFNDPNLYPYLASDGTAGTGFFYYYNSSTTTQSASETAATGLTIDGQSGYLAAIPSATVNSFVLSGAVSSNLGTTISSTTYLSGLSVGSGTAGCSYTRCFEWQYGPFAGQLFTYCSNTGASCTHVSDSGLYQYWDSSGGGNWEPNGSLGYAVVYFEESGNTVVTNGWDDQGATSSLTSLVEFGGQANALDGTSGSTTNGDFLSSTATMSVPLAAAPSITNAGLSGTTQYATKGGAFTLTITGTSGVGSPTYSATGLPTNFAINASTGVISATSTVTNADTAGAYSVTVTNTDGNGATATVSFTIQIVAAPTLTAPTSGLVVPGGQSYSLAAIESGGAPPLTYSATGLPTGLSVNQSTGAISGTASTSDAVGAYAVTLTVTDLNNVTATASFTLTVTQLPTVATPTVSAVTNSTATITASVNPSSGQTYVLICYSTSNTVTASGSMSGATCSGTGAQSATVAVSPLAASTTATNAVANLTGLSANVTYYYVVYASNASGSVTQSGSFTTNRQAQTTLSIVPVTTTTTAYTSTNIGGGEFVCFDAAGEMFVGDRSANAVTKVVNGVTTITTANSYGPTGCAVDAAGNVWVVANAATNTVWEYSNSLTLLHTFTVSGVAFNNPQFIGFSPTGVLTVSNWGDTANGVVTLGSFNYTANTVVSTLLTSTNAISRPTGLAWDSAGNLYVVGNGASLLYKCSASTCYQIFSGFYQPVGVAVSPSGNVFVSGYNPTQNTTIGSEPIVELTGSGFTTYSLVTTFSLGTAVTWGPMSADAAGNLYENYGAAMIEIPAGVWGTTNFAGTVAQNVALTTSGGSGSGSLTWALQAGGTATGCAVSSSGVVTATSVGTCLVNVTKAQDATYSAATSSTVTVNFYGLPSAPSVTATAGDGQVTLSWSAFTALTSGNQSLTNITVLYGTSSTYSADETPASCTLTTSSTSCVITGLTNGTTYYFNVAGENAQGYGAVGTATAKAITAPIVTTSAVTGLTNTTATLNGTVNAKDASTSALGFCYTTTSGTYTSCSGLTTATTSPATATGSTATAESAALTGLTPNTTYYYVLYATNSQATTWSATGSFTTLPDVPTGVTASAGSNGSLNVSWTAPTSGTSAITGYAIQYSSNSGSSWTSATTNTGSTATTFTIPSLSNGTSYIVEVAAINAGGTGAWSTASSATSTNGVPSTPTGITVTAVANVTNGSAAQFTVSWTASSGNGQPITGYTVTTTPSAGTCTTTGATTCTISSGLSVGTSYVVNVTATNSVGTSSAGTSSSTLAMTLPNAPTDVVAVPAASQQATVTWVAPTNNGGSAISGYVVAYSTDNTNWTTLIANTGTSATTYLATGLTNGTAYYFQVAAINADGTGPTSSSAAATFLDQTTSHNNAGGSGASNLTVSTSGPLNGGSTTFPGSGSAYLSTTNQVASPGPTTFSLAVWFKTSTSGVIAAFTSSQNNPSGASSYDRELFINASGNLVFGIWTTGEVSASTSGTYTDNKWHLAVVTFSSSGTNIYVDGALAATNATMTTPESYAGYWAIGQGNFVLWSSAPTNNYFTGSLAQFAIIPTALTAAQVTTLDNETSDAGYASYVTGTLAASAYWTLSATVTPGAANTITFATAPSSVYTGEAAGTHSVSATATSGTISYVSTTTAVCTVNASSGAITVVSAGTCTIQASESGQAANVQAAAPVTQSFTIAAGYSMTYLGNSNTGGAVPVDTHQPYAPGATVTVLANTGNLVQTGYTFAGWNTLANGTGTAYAASGSATFTISQNTNLYAQWTLNAPTISSVAISGTNKVTQVLTATNTGVTGTSTTISYAWQWSLTPTGTFTAFGTNASTQVLGVGNAGDYIRVVTTVTNTAGSASATSAVVGPVVGEGSDGTVTNPYQVAFDPSGRMFVASRTVGIVMATAAQVAGAMPVSSFATVESNKTAVDGVTVDASGDIFFITQSTFGLYEITAANVATCLASPATCPETTLAQNSGYNGAALAIAPNGNLYYSTYGGTEGLNVITAANLASGANTVQSVCTLPTTSSAPALGFDAAGDLVYSGANVYFVTAANLALGNCTGTEILASTYEPWGVAFSASGNLYIAQQTGSQIVEITASQLTNLAAAPYTATTVVWAGTSFSLPLGLTFDTLGNIYVANFGTNLVLRYNSGNETGPAYGGTGATLTYAVGSNSSITGALVTSSKTYYVGSPYAGLLGSNGLSLSGYLFAGWCSVDPGPATPTTCASGNIVTSSTVMVSGGQTIYPYWGVPQTLTYAVGQNANVVGSPTTPTQQYLTGAALSSLMSSNGLSLVGYSFAGWCTADPGATPTTCPGSIVTSASVMPSGGETLYPYWSAASQTLTYAKGTHSGIAGSVTTATQSVTTGATLSGLLGANGLSLAGYTFAGWCTTDPGTTPTTCAGTVVTTASIMPAGGETIYPTWSLNPATTLTTSKTILGSITLSWTAPATSDVTGYEIWSSTDGSTWSVVNSNTASTATTYTVSSLTNTTAYYFKVAALTASATSVPVYVGATTSPGTATTTLSPQAALTLYGTTPAMGLASTGMRGSTTDAYGNEYVANTNSGVFDELPAGGGAVRTVSLIGAQGVATIGGMVYGISWSGGLYIINFRTGVATNVVSPSALQSPGTIVAQNGYLYVATYGSSGSILRYDPNTWASTTVYAGNVNTLGLAFDSSGNLYFGSGTSIYKCTNVTSCTPTLWANATGVTASVTLGTMAFDAANNLYIANWPSSSATQLIEYPSSGGVASPSAGLLFPVSLNEPWAVSVNNAGNLLVSNLASSGNFDLVGTSALSNIYTSSVTLLATGGSSASTITYAKVSGANCTVSSNVVSATAPGVCVVSATMAANSTYAAVTTQLTITFTGTASSLSVGVSAASVPVTNTVTVSNSGYTGNATVTYGVDDGTINGHASTTGCAVNGTSLTATQVGSCYVYAIAPATSTYAAVTSNDYQVFFNGPSTALSTITVSPTSLTANGSSTATITITAKDANGIAFVGSAGTVTVATTLGSVSSVTDNHNGTYSATLTAGSSAGTATISATIAGSSLTSSATVTMIAGTASQLVVVTQPSSTVATNTSTGTFVVKLEDAQGNNVTTSGITVTLSATNSGALSGTLSATTNAQGQATFTGVLLTGAPGSYQLIAASSGLTSATSAAITVTNPTYTVSYNLDGGSGGPTDANGYTYNQAVTVLFTPAPTLAGYGFFGWCSVALSPGVACGAAGGTNYLASNNFSFVMGAANVTLYAIWLPTHTITFALGSVGSPTGTLPTQAPLAGGSHFTLPSASGLTNTGYTFTGWFDGSFVAQPGYSYTMGGTAVTLTAQWTIEQFSITYVTGAGVSGTAPAAQTLNYQTTTTLATGSGLSLTGYAFAGWCSAAVNTATTTCGGTTYAGGATFQVPAAATTLYALWAPVYTVTFIYDGGSGGVTSATYSAAGSSITLPTAVQSGYGFAGWYSQAVAGTLIGQAGATFAPGANTVLFAQWVAQTYTVTYFANGANAGTVPLDPGNPFHTGAVVTILGNVGNLTRAGYYFAGWSTSGFTFQAGNQFTISNANVVLSAVWHAQTAQAITFPLLSSVTYGSAAPTLHATATSNLPITYTAVSSTATICSVTTSGTVTLIGAGTCAIMAAQPGSSMYSAATPVIQSFTIYGHPQTITFPAIATQVIGSSVLVPGATASSGLPVSYSSITNQTCTVTSAGAIALVAAGTCAIQATQLGNAQWAAAVMVTVTFAVSKGTPVITFGAAPQGVSVGEPVGTHNVVATSTLGTVSFSTTTSTICAVNATTGALTAILAGTCVVQASVAATTATNTASASQSVAILPAAIHVSFGAAPTNVTLGAGTYAVTAQASSGTVTYATLTPNVCTINATTGALTLVGVGLCTVSAAATNQPNSSVAPVTQSFSVAGQVQANVSLGTTSVAYGTTNNTLTLVGIGGSGAGAFSYSLATGSSATGCAISAGVLAWTSAGTCAVLVTKAGDTTHSGTSATVFVTIAPAAQTLSFTTATPTSAVVGQSFSVAASATSGLGVSVSIDNAAQSVCALAGATVTVIGAGTCVVDANQSGNTNYLAAAQVQQRFNVSLVAQQITFTSVAPGAAQGNGQPTALAYVGGTPYAVSATGGASGLPVIFVIDAASTGVCAMNAGDDHVSFLSAGTCTIDATQAGNPSYAPAALVQQSFAIQINAQSVSFTSAPPTASVNTGTYVPVAVATSGLQVTITPTSSSAGICTMNSAGVVSFVGAGLCVLAASQSGSAAYAPATTVNQSILVAPATQAISVLSAPPTNPLAGGTYNVAATASSGLTVTISVDAATTNTACTVTNGVVNFANAGLCALDFTQVGNANYVAAQPVQQVLTVQALNQNVYFYWVPAQLNFTPGQAQTTSVVAYDSSDLPVTISVDVASGTGCSLSGAANFDATSGLTTQVIAITGGGLCILDASQAGNGQVLAASTQSAFYVTPATQNLNFTSTAPANAHPGDTYQALVTDDQGLTPNYSVDPASTSGACTVSSTGLVTFTGAGTCILDVDQVGNDSFLAATQIQQSISVSLIPQSINLTTAAPSSAYVSDPYTPAAQTSSTLPVTFSVSWPGSLEQVCSIDQTGAIYFLAAGTCVVTATQVGNSVYAAAAPVTQSFYVAPAPQVLTFTSATPTNAAVGGTYTPVAVSDSGLSVTTSIDATTNPLVCAMSNGVVSFTGQGTCLIDANQAGTQDYYAAATVQQAVAVGLNAQTIAFTGTLPTAAVAGTPSNLTLGATSNAGTTVTLSVDPTASAICAINPSGLVTYVAAGLCVINASAPATAAYGQAVATEHFTITAAPVVVAQVSDDATTPVTPLVPTSTSSFTSTGAVLVLTPLPGAQTYRVVITNAAGQVVTTCTSTTTTCVINGLAPSTSYQANVTGLTASGVAETMANGFSTPIVTEASNGVSLATTPLVTAVNGTITPGASGYVVLVSRTISSRARVSIAAPGFTWQRVTLSNGEVALHIAARTSVRPGRYALTIIQGKHRVTTSFVVVRTQRVATASA